MNNLDIQQTELMDLVDEKIATKTLKELETFLATEMNGEKNSDFLLKNAKRGSNKHATISQEFILLMLKVLKEIANKNAVTIAGKKTRITAQQAMQLIDVNIERFNEMIENKTIKCHETKHSYYVNMEDVIKGKKAVYESRGKLLKKISSMEW